jgi:hypothetical protein
MPQLRPSWQLSFGTAGVLLAVVVVGSLVGRRWPLLRLTTVTAFAREFAAIMSLLGLWQLVGAAAHTRVAGAMERGRQIHSWEAAWHLPSERALQAAVDAVPRLVRAADVYYAYAHLNGMALFVLWLWWWRREVYPRARLVIIWSTFACLVVQLVPVAPPRLLPDLGFVDTALRDGHSVYGPFGSGVANQLAAMPSVHVAWALIVAWYVAGTAPRRWRWIGPLHAVVTVLVVVVTGNHWWMDGLVAAGFVLLPMMMPRAWPVAWKMVRGWSPVSSDVSSCPGALGRQGGVRWGQTGQPDGRR